MPPASEFSVVRYDTPDFAPLPQDAAAVSGAVEKRRREFSAGRTASRAALGRLGFGADATIPIGPNRNPLWPDGVVGSITHTDGLAAAAVSRSRVLLALGLDLERTDAVGPDLWKQVLVPGELAWLLKCPPEDQRGFATAIFCAKEAFYKLQFPITGFWIDFKEAEVILSPNIGEFILTCHHPTAPTTLHTNRFPGRYAVGLDFTLAAIHISPVKQG